MRRSYNALLAKAQQLLGRDPFNGGRRVERKIDTLAVTFEGR
jgi:hypothetical protein